MKSALVLVAFVLGSGVAFAAPPTDGTPPANYHAKWTGQSITFDNGAKIDVSGSTLTTTADGKTTTVDRRVSPPPPRSFASCAYMRKWLDTHPVNNTWRANSLVYADACF